MYHLLGFVALLLLLWVRAGSWGRLVVITVDLVAGALLSMPRGVTISTYVGMVRDGDEHTKYEWQHPIAVSLANALDDIDASHCHRARESDHQAALASAAYTAWR